jgi:hypothetical protein
MHLKYKRKYRASNWSDYDHAIAQRRDIRLERAAGVPGRSLSRTLVAGQRWRPDPIIPATAITQGDHRASHADILALREGILDLSRAFAPYGIESEKRYSAEEFERILDGGSNDPA